MGRTARTTSLMLRGFPVVLMEYEDGHWNLHVMGPSFLRHEVEEDQTLTRYGQRAFPDRQQIVRIYADGRRAIVAGMVENHLVTPLLTWWDAHPEPWSVEVRAWREPDGTAVGRSGIGYIEGTVPEAFTLTEQEAEAVLALIDQQTTDRVPEPQG